MARVFASFVSHAAAGIDTAREIGDWLPAEGRDVFLFLHQDGTPSGVSTGRPR